MVKNFSDCARFQDGGDDFQCSPAMRAMLNVNIEHPLEQTRAQLIRTEAEEGGTASFVQDGLLLFFLLPGTKLRVGREHALETNEVEPWPGN